MMDKYESNNVQIVIYMLEQNIGIINFFDKKLNRLKKCIFALKSFNNNI